MSYLTANDAPGVHAPSWYADTAGAAEHYHPLDGDTQADVCIVGAGFAGLSAALHLAEQGVSVRVLEANRVGWGASGRNGGQLGIGPRADIDVYERMVGPNDARKIWDLAISANQLVRDLITHHQIDCDLSNGYMEAAAKPRHVMELHEFAEHVNDCYDHNTIRVIGREEMRALLGTDAYHGGYRDDLGAHLHPLKLARGLAQAAVKAGATIHELTRVTAVHPGRVETAMGAVTAPHILLACNGYLDGLAPRPQRRMLPINNYVLATEPLGANRARQVNRENLCVSDTRFVLNYFRLTPDNRMLWGGGESYGRTFPVNLKNFVRTRMLEIYPDLSDVAITHAWGGTLAITGTRMPLFHEMGCDVKTIGGWSGSGIHMATMGGKIAAEAIGGNVHDWELLARMPSPAFPGGDWFRMPLLRLAMLWYGLRDRL
ncbi:MAG: NAD(P)/FAD-dependent oxidoreductase [Paracoccaceae bacterium]